MWGWFKKWLQYAPDGGAKPGAKRHKDWPAVRNRFVAANPVCAVCGSRENLVAHHIKPYHLYPSLELNEHNLITLCEGPVVNCHLLFGHWRSWKAWNPFVVIDATIWRKKISIARALKDEKSDPDEKPLDQGGAVE